MANLRKTLDIILRKYGHDIYLQRKDFTIHPQGPHQIRNNQGYRKELEKHTVRNRFPITTGMSNVISEKLEGLAHNVDMIYYFRHDANPKEGDRIYEKDDRFKDRSIYPGFATYIISYTVPNRGRGGEIAYWIAGVKREEPN